MSKPPHLAAKNTVEANPISSAPSSTNNERCGQDPYSDSESGQRKRKRSAGIRVELSLQSLIPPQGKQLVSSKGCGSQSNEDEIEKLEVDWDAVVERAMSHPHEAREFYFKQARPMREMTTDCIELGSSRGYSFNYKPLHAACKYDPSLEAIEALLHAHPSAAIDCTFEGTALKIAAESRASLMVLRLLLVAELAMWMTMRKRLLQEKERQALERESSNRDAIGENENDAMVEERETSSLYHGKNPIHWICEPHIPVKTVAMLLTWYPNGAFKRPSVSEGAPFDLVFDSPLIEIIDDFARDQDELEDDRDAIEDDVEDEYDEVASESDKSSEKMSTATLRPERRWQKFLHIIHATDRVLNLPRPLPLTVGMNIGETCQSHEFRAVHAFIRCITNPKLGLELCQAYGVWSIVREMHLRIPEDFVGSFEVLAERKAADCRLCHEEMKDIVEYLVDVDHKTAFAPRISDGRLLGHVALENGWPCKEVISHKKTATCA